MGGTGMEIKNKLTCFILDFDFGVHSLDTVIK